MTYEICGTVLSTNKTSSPGTKFLDTRDHFGVFGAQASTLSFNALKTVLPFTAPAAAFGVHRRPLSGKVQDAETA